MLQQPLPGTAGGERREVSCQPLYSFFFSVVVSIGYMTRRRHGVSQTPGPERVAAGRGGTWDR